MSDEHYGYIAVPVWDGKAWQPINIANNHSSMPWPAGVDPNAIAKPLFNIGDSVHFHWSNGVRQGVIRKISKRGGSYREIEGHNGELAIATERYAKPPTYEIYWNGHGRLVDEKNIVSQ